jgi:hypothetical protein
LPVNYYLVVITAGDNIAAPIVIYVVGRVFGAWDISRADYGPQLRVKLVTGDL